MDQQTKAAVAQALDEATASVCVTTYNRLCDEYPQDASEMIRRARVELEKVKQLGMPDYANPFVAPFHAAYYQEQHVNLAYSLLDAVARLRDATGRPLTDTGSLHVIDFGCGALATQFGVILAISDALQRGQDADRVLVHSIDNSEPMMQIGIHIWNEFANACSSRPHLRTIANIMDKIEWCISYDANVSVVPESDCWLSALHVIYDENRPKVVDAMTLLQNQHDPCVGLMTFHGGNEFIAREIWPFQPSPKLDAQYQFDNSYNSSNVTNVCRRFGIYSYNGLRFWTCAPGTRFLSYVR